MAEDLPRYLPRRTPGTGERVETRSRQPIRSQVYLEWCRRQPCARCHDDPPSDPHHHGRGGTALKTDDLRCLPLCRVCHELAERRLLNQSWLDERVARHVLRFLGLSVRVVRDPQCELG